MKLIEYKKIIPMTIAGADRKGPVYVSRDNVKFYRPIRSRHGLWMQPVSWDSIPWKILCPLGFHSLFLNEESTDYRSMTWERVSKEKWAKKVLDRVENSYAECDFRRPSGILETRFLLDDEPGVKCSVSYGEFYGKTRYRNTDALHVIKVHPNWSRTAWKLCKGVMDHKKYGKVLVLSAKRIRAGVWKVLFVRQGRGTHLAEDYGVIVRHAGEIALSSSEKSARDTIVRKFKEAFSA